MDENRIVKFLNLAYHYKFYNHFAIYIDFFDGIKNTANNETYGDYF